MAHRNAEIIWLMMDASEKRVVRGAEGVAGIDDDGPMAPDVVVHFDPGGSHCLAGDYVGSDGRKRLVGTLVELSGGTVRFKIHDVVGGDGWAAMCFTITAERGGLLHTWVATSEFRFEGDRIVEDWIRPAPRTAVERFCQPA